MFKESISWSMVTSGMFSVRYYPSNFTANVAGVSCYPKAEYMLYILALMNTGLVTILTKTLNPTLNSNAGDIEKIPIIINPQKIPVVNELTRLNIAFSKKDWDSYETSWDFKRHPLV